MRPALPALAILAGLAAGSMARPAAAEDRPFCNGRAVLTEVWQSMEVRVPPGADAPENVAMFHMRLRNATGAALSFRAEFRRNGLLPAPTAEGSLNPNETRAVRVACQPLGRVFTDLKPALPLPEVAATARVTC